MTPRAVLRRSAVVASVALGASLLAASTPASSVPPSTYSSDVVSYGALPTNGWSTGSTCSSEPAFALAEGPGGAPSGLGSLQVTTTEGGGAARVELPAYGLAALALSTITAHYDVVASSSPFGSPASLLVTVQDPAYPDAWTYVSIEGGQAGEGWKTLDLLTSAVDVDVRDKATGAEVVATTTSTWGQFRAFTEGAMVVGATLVTGCWTTATVAWDDVTITAAGVSTTYDLEPVVPVALTSAASPTTVGAGSSATISGALTRQSDSTGVVGAAVELQAQPLGSATWTTVATAMSGTGGALSRSVAPTKQTAYRWHVAGEAYGGSADSTSRTVSVRPVVTLNRLSSSVTYPAPVVLWGSTKPTLAGKTVTLHRVGSSTAVGTTTVRSDGTFAFGKKMPRGSWTFYVTLPATTGLTSATSAKLAVKVA